MPAIKYADNSALKQKFEISLRYLGSPKSTCKIKNNDAKSKIDEKNMK